IVFHARRKDDQQKGFATRNVWSVGADGSGEKKLTSGTKDEYHASLSPDGKKLLFVSELNGSRDIWLADADGQNPVPLTGDPGTEAQPAWSPDGHQIAYAAFPTEGGSFDIWLVNADGSGRRRLTTTPADEPVGAWHAADRAHRRARARHPSRLVARRPHARLPAPRRDGMGDLDPRAARRHRAHGAPPPGAAGARRGRRRHREAPQRRHRARHGRGGDLQGAGRLRRTRPAARGGGEHPLRQRRARARPRRARQRRHRDRLPRERGHRDRGRRAHAAPRGRADRAAQPAGRQGPRRRRELPRRDAQRRQPPRVGRLRPPSAEGGQPADGPRYETGRPGRVRRGRREGDRRAGERRQPDRPAGRRAPRAGARRGCEGRRPSEHDPHAGARRGAPGEHGRIMTRPAPAAALLLFLGCAGVHPYHPNFYSVDGDIRLGQQLQKEVESEVTLLRLSALTQLVNSIGQRLQESAPDPAFKLFPYSFRVVDSPEVNAFALPGGPIYINSALIELCDTEDQLASVIGHEMGHVAARHATEMLTTQNLTQLALIAAVSVIPVPVPP